MARAAIFGCAGRALDTEERRFFSDADPLGFILFGRNCEQPDQIRALVADLRGSVGRADAPILIDQEGGRVARLHEPHWRRPPPAVVFGRLAERRPREAGRAAWLNARLMAADLAGLGITVDCAPVLDLPVCGAHDVIGDRAFGRDANVVARLGRETCSGLLAGNVLPVIKHLPGHGRARADSHAELPVVEAPEAELAASDFRPFAALAEAPWGMTAHVLFHAIDPDRPATTSRKVLQEVVRGTIGFSGVLTSDDLAMKALSGDFRERAWAALAAGCDLVLHCNGEMAEMAAVAEGAGAISTATQARLARGEALRRESLDADVDVEAMRRELDGLLREA